jgi:predicted PurR-regulated permease PerM
MTLSPRPLDLPRILLAVLALTVLIAGAAWVLRPFLLALVWAAMIAVSTWPVLLWLQRRLGGKRAPAVAVMVLLLLLVLVVPMYLAISTIVENGDRIVEAVRSASTMTLPAPPGWLGTLPLVGPRLEAGWLALAERGPGSAAASLAPYGRQAFNWLAETAGGFGGTLLQFLLTVVISGVLFSGGEGAATGLRRFFRRLAGARGEAAVELAGKAVRAVALGVVVTAVVQSVLAGVGLAVAGVPHAGLLAAIALVLCIAQIGPMLVLAPSVIWLYTTGAHGWAAALLIWSIGVGTIDNVLRPILIRKGADLPLLLIFAGVIGGLLGFGVVGLFIGPAVLAVAYTLTTSWIAELDGEPALVDGEGPPGAR